jgi:hypothetical protein
VAADLLGERAIPLADGRRHILDTLNATLDATLNVTLHAARHAPVGNLIDDLIDDLIDAVHAREGNQFDRQRAYFP